jgi:glycosyltransferase involved in cell wall biosynthesis
MSINPLLSICIPVFNRKKNLTYLLDTVDFVNGIEVIVVDDGSNDGIEKIFQNHEYNFSIKFYKSKVNRGRSASLADAIKYSKGRFIIIMDSDDYFLPGALSLIISSINEHQNQKCFVFGIQLLQHGILKNNLPPRNLETNLLELRADYRVKGDLKEVVDAKLLKKCIYKKAYKFRRTPTSLMWFYISNLCKSFTINKPIIYKNYKKFGMTDQIRKLKFENAEPMCELYYNYSVSKNYKSYYFRIKSKILFYRYLFLSKKKIEIKIKDIIFFIIGFSFSVYDKITYKFFNFKN